MQELKSPKHPNKQKPKHPTAKGGELPLELQYRINKIHRLAIATAIVTIIVFVFIPWGIFYIYFSQKLDPKKVPDKNLLLTAGIATLPFCGSILFFPLIMTIRIFRLREQLVKFETEGPKAFKTDQEFLASQEKRNKRSKKIWIIALLTILVFSALIALGAILDKG